jgi:hypothetical protein
MTTESDSALEQRWDAFCSKHNLENVDLRLDEIDGLAVLHIGIVVGDWLRAFDTPEQLERNLAQHGLRLLRYDVQGDSASMAVTAL